MKAMRDRDRLAIEIGSRLQAHLLERDGRDQCLSVITTGASFEGWLSFETRLLLERARRELELPVEHFWIGNEYKKIDLGIVHYDDVTRWTREAWLAAIELKLVYNNKNWRERCNSAWADLFPP